MFSALLNKKISPRKFVDERYDIFPYKGISSTDKITNTAQEQLYVYLDNNSAKDISKVIKQYYRIKQKAFKDCKTYVNFMTAFGLAYSVIIGYSSLDQIAASILNNRMSWKISFFILVFFLAEGRKDLAIRYHSIWQHKRAAHLLSKKGS